MSQLSFDSLFSLPETTEAVVVKPMMTADALYTREMYTPFWYRIKGSRRTF